MLKVLKLILILVVVAIVLQQAGLYYSVVITGNYIGNASIGSSVFTVLVWPITVLVLAYAAIRTIIKFKFSNV